MTPVRLEPAAPRSRVKHSTTEPSAELVHRDFNAYCYPDVWRVLCNDKVNRFHKFLFVCFVALRPKSTAMVIAGRSVHTISWAGLNKRLTSNSCTYFRL